jgi:hypothetical protein
MSTDVLVLWWSGRGGDGGGTYYVGRRPIANGCVVGSKSTIGLIRGETLWMGAISSGDCGGRARVRQYSGVVAVARGWNMEYYVEVESYF